MKRCVVKIGSALLTNDGRGLDREGIRGWVDQMAQLREAGWRVALVSSGSIAEGVARLGWLQRPQALYRLQAAAAVGQMGLIQAYESCFQAHGLKTAQVLLTHDDVAGRRRYLNARSTIRTLLELGVVPVINENDTVATDEIRLGDNDTLAGLVANLVEADELIILTDQRGLFTEDPRTNPDARLVASGRAGDPKLLALAGSGSAIGRGGMRTKLEAARLAARSGTRTHIASGREPDVLIRIANGESIGTQLEADDVPMAARKRWLASQGHAQGGLTLDDGAVAAVRDHGRSLLAVGITSVAGTFGRGALVACMNTLGEEIARGLANYDSTEIAQLVGCPSQDIAERLGYVDEPELIHRDNLVVLTS
ncbi:MAG: glutamate 5-kinase [Gammaproteobacteria bacterium]|nr:glutamate 5-kinase [Gammaproteobacteria bacterium]